MIQQKLEKIIVEWIYRWDADKVHTTELSDAIHAIYQKEVSKCLPTKYEPCSYCTLLEKRFFEGRNDVISDIRAKLKERGLWHREKDPLITEHLCEDYDEPKQECECKERKSTTYSTVIPEPYCGDCGKQIEPKDTEGLQKLNEIKDKWGTPCQCELCRKHNVPADTEELREKIIKLLYKHDEETDWNFQEIADEILALLVK